VRCAPGFRWISSEASCAVVDNKKGVRNDEIAVLAQEVTSDGGFFIARHIFITEGQVEESCLSRMSRDELCERERKTMKSGLVCNISALLQFHIWRFH
jgi:hypothetical protein